MSTETASWPWLTTLPLYASHVCASYVTCEWSGHHSSLVLEAAKTLVHAFISRRLDYCNSLLYGVSDSLLAKLQTVQNAAARVITGTRRKFNHITPVLRDLYWLPVRQRITFKLAMNDGLQVPTRSGTVLPGWCLHSRLVRRRQVGACSCGRRTAGHSLCQVVAGTRTSIGQRKFAVRDHPGPWPVSVVPYPLAYYSLIAPADVYK